MEERDLTGELIAERFRVGAVRAPSLRAVLYDGEDVTTGLPIVLKVARASASEPAIKAAFFARTERVAALPHRAILHPIAWGEVDPATDPRFYVALEPAPSPTPLDEALEPGRALHVLGEVAGALGACHDAGLVHADLEPNDVYVDEAGKVGCSVLSVSRVASDVKRNTTASMNRPLWMAPEETETTNVLTPRTDVWSFGLFAFWLLTGKSYWKTSRDTGSASMTLLRELMFDPLVSASSRAAELDVGHRLPPGFDAWFAQTVNRVPDKRWADIRQAHAALVPLFAGFVQAPSSPQATPNAVAPSAVASKEAQRPGTAEKLEPSPPSRVRRRLERTVVVLAVLLAFVGLSAVAAVWYFKDRADRAVASAKDRESESDESDDADDKPRPKDKPWADTACPIPVTSADPVWGERAAPVTLVEFGDYESTSSAITRKVVADLKAEFGPTKLRVVWKHAPASIHKSAEAVAVASEIVFRAKGIEGWSQFSDSAWRHLELPDTSEAQVPAELVEKWMKDAGVIQLFRDRAEDQSRARSKVMTDTSLATSLQVRFTPTMFVNGVRIRGTSTIDAFRVLVREQITAAEDETKKGTPADQVYVTLTTRNFTTRGQPLTDVVTPPPIDPTVYKVLVGKAPTLGPADAYVTIVEFGDFQCPFCRRAVDMITKVNETYKDDVRIAWKDAPMAWHKRAIAAANFAREVRAKKGNEGFWKAHKLLFDNARALEDSDLEGYAVTLGVGKTIVLAVKTEKHKNAIESDRNEFDTFKGGVPLFFVNGRKVTGARPFDEFRKLIDEELIKAKDLVTSGKATKATVYEEIMKAAQTP